MQRTYGLRPRREILETRGLWPGRPGRRGSARDAEASRAACASGWRAKRNWSPAQATSIRFAAVTFRRPDPRVWARRV